jgi:predicted metal-dependent phosphoesterase TrpH
MMRIDLHTHSSRSDGTDSPAELVANAVTAGLQAVALCDHDVFTGIAEAQQAGEQLDLEILPGVEMSTHMDIGDGQEESVHMLGYGPRRKDPELNAVLEASRAGRQDRIPETLRRLADLGMPLSLDEVKAQAASTLSVGRPHVADAMVAKGYVRDRREAFSKYLAEGGPAYVVRWTPTVEQTIERIVAAGGVAVIAHPWGRGHKEYVPESQFARWRDLGLAGLEAHHTDHSPADQGELVEIAGRLSMLVTGSSDYHGLGKPDNPLGIFTTDPAVYADIRARIGTSGGELT